jgi:hypothetical protein
MCSLSKMLEELFEDKRMTSAVMMSWLCIVLVVYGASGVSAHHGQFLHVGPSEETVVMGIAINTWPKWYALAILAFLKTGMNEFVGASIDPWIINTVQDEKTNVLPYAKSTCLVIVLLYQIYGHIMSVFGIALLLSQVDFLLIRMVADTIVTTFAMNRFMANKQVKVYYGLTESGTEMASEVAST